MKRAHNGRKREAREMGSKMSATVEAAATITDVTPEVLAAMRHAAVPTAPAMGAAAPVAESETLPEWAARLLSNGSSIDALAGIDAAERDRDDAVARLAAHSARLGEWFTFALHAHADSVKGSAWVEMTGTTAQEFGRLRGAALLFNAYGKRGASFAITEAEAKRLADSKGVGKCETMAAEIGRKIDPLDVRGFRKAGKPIRGNAAIVAGSLAPAAPAAPPVVETPAAPVVPEGSNNGTPVAPEDAPSLGTPAAPVAPAGSVDTSEVFVMPAPSEWLRIVEAMAGQADRLASGQRERMMAACETLHAALLAL